MTNLDVEEMSVGAEAQRKTSASPEDEIRFVPLVQLKREVKQITEEAVTKRFISEESSAVLALCCSVENCLAHNLKRRVFGLFGATSTLALLQNVAGMCPPASSILRMVVQIEQQSFKDQKRLSFDRLNDSPKALLSRERPTINLRYLWIRLALFEKVLSTIVDYIAKHAHKYYEKDALMADPVAGSMVAALLMGPCALEFSKAKTLDHYFSDPPADELLQRHRIHARSPGRQAFSPKSPRTTLQVRRTESLGPDDMTKKISTNARDYVMSLHQNTKATLLYGKNNVLVYPCGDSKAMKGYLSLHKNSADSLIVKWMPNELVHTNSDPETDFMDRSIFWKYALCLNVQDLVYIHCHNRGDDGGSIVLIGTDGVQHPPIHLPPGQHPLAFMSCLENGLMPWGQLDPPLWLQKGKGQQQKHKGKVFPKLRRRSSFVSMNDANLNMNGELVGDQQQQLQQQLANDNNNDYVFRIVPINRPTTTASYEEIDKSSIGNGVLAKLSTLNAFSTRVKDRLRRFSGSSPGSSPPATPLSMTDSRGSPQTTPPQTPQHYFYDVITNTATLKLDPPVLTSQVSAPALLDCHSPVDKLFSPSRMVLKYACDSMKSQILSRAFYGWLAHCKNMKTIRTHLINLVNNRIIPVDHPKDASCGLTSRIWEEIRANLNDASREEFYRYVYYGGVEPALRVKVWPFLLNLYDWTDSDVATTEKYFKHRDKYENSVTEWLAVEAIVREKDREAFKAACENRNGPGIVKTTSEVNDNYRLDDFGDDDDSSYKTAQSPHHETPNNLHRAATLGAEQRDAVVTKRQAQQQRPSSRNGECRNSGSNKHSFSNRSTPEEGDGGVYSKDLVDLFAMNLHRIEKDVHRCDRNYYYFMSKRNLEKLKNIMCTYVWENLDNGYVQGMCDLAAPLLVIFDDEVLTYGCFMIIMKRLTPNFPHGTGMDANLINMRSLLQIMDPELFDLMQQNGDYTHFYFCYRWFLLDFKRELVYDDVFYVWEVIWAGMHIASPHFILFLSLALVETYREIIIDNNMDFTDIIKFFNEMAERHDAKSFTSMARDFVYRLQKAVY